MNVIAYIGAPEIGQGAETVLTQIIAEGFDIELEKVKIIAGDTANSPYDRGPTGSRFTYHTGNAVRKAIADVKQKIAMSETQKIMSPCQKLVTPISKSSLLNIKTIGKIAVLIS